MSVLDRIFSESGATNDAAIQTLSTQLTQAQQLLATQQGLIDAISGTDVSQNSEDVTHSSAISALQAAQSLATAQLSTLSESAIASAYGLGVVRGRLQKLWGTGLDVREYTAIDENGDSEPLTNANFETALRAAVAAAVALCDAPEDNDANKGGAAVLIPPGNWEMAEGLVLHNPGFPKYAPSLIGLGAPGSVILRFNSSAVFPGLLLGCNEDGTIEGHICRGVTVQNIGIYMTGISRKGGIRARCTYQCTIRDVTIRGAGQDWGGPWHERGGLDFRNNIVGESFGPNNNHEHLLIERTSVFYSYIGAWFGEALWSATVKDLNVNGCEYGALYEGAVLGWWGGNCQGGEDGARHSSGAMYTTGLPNGAAAAVSAPSSGISTVTGLTSMAGYPFDTGHAYSYKGSFLEIGNDIYRIDEVIDATSCTIRRSSGGALTAQTWQVRGCAGGNEVVLSGQIYHETSTGPYYLETGRDFVMASYWRLQSVQAKIQTAAVAATGCEGGIAVNDIRASGALIARLNQVVSFVADVGIDRIDADDTSRGGIVARYPAATDGTAGHVWDSRPRATRYNAALKERGAIIFDARRTSSIVLGTGTDVTSWKDLTGTATLSKINAGYAPQYEALDAGLGAPAIRMLGDEDNTHMAGLAGNIGGFFPNGLHTLTLLVVARVPVVASANTRRIVMEIPGGPLQAYVGFDDAQHSSDLDFYAFYFLQGTGWVAPDLVPRDISAHWLYTTFLLSGANAAGGGSDVVPFSPRLTMHGAYRTGIQFPSSIQLSAYSIAADATAGRDLLVSHIAVLPHGLTIGERDHYLQLAQSEFNVSE